MVSSTYSLLLAAFTVPGDAEGVSWETLADERF